ncbi:MAG: transketolase [Spirochaetes bacterium]|nr:transketolase [Spirochaetota bacterium]
MEFPINLKKFVQQEFSTDSEISEKDLSILQENIQLIRDAIVFFTCISSKRGFGGHTGGAYDVVPETLILNGFMNKKSNNIIPVFYDEAGHRVALQYIMAVINGHMDAEKLFHYREHNHGLYGHPEREDHNGIFFSSGRLGHMWSYVNGIAEANRDKKVIMLGSDGSQMEGDDAEAARYAVARNLNVKLFLDDNDVTIAGHPSVYLKGYELDKTLKGHGLAVDTGDGENIPELFERIRASLQNDGPAALINKRKMAPKIEGIEGSPHGHDVIPADKGVFYLESKGYTEAVNYINSLKSGSSSVEYKGSTKEMDKNRDLFGKFIADQILKINEADRIKKVIVVDSDLEGSCGLHHIRKASPEVYVSGGIMERNNFSVASGFGSEKGRQGIFGTFAAFSEMIISELTMARLNNCNVIAHFSHTGIDDMADNTCHFGINNMFLDNGLTDDKTTRLYFPADSGQMKALINKIFNEEGIRFVFSTRSAVPHILKENSTEKYYNDDYIFSGKDEIIRQGKKVYVVSYGDMLYRSLDAVETLRAEGIDAALINKPVLNTVDEEMMKRICSSDTQAVIVAETQNVKTGLGSRMGTILLERGFKGKFAVMGVSIPGQGGLSEHIPFQGLAPENIVQKVKSMI